MRAPNTPDRNAPPPRDETAERYLDLWDRNQSEIARQGPPPTPLRPV